MDREAIQYAGAMPSRKCGLINQNVSDVQAIFKIAMLRKTVNLEAWWMVWVWRRGNPIFGALGIPPEEALDESPCDVMEQAENPDNAGVKQGGLALSAVTRCTHRSSGRAGWLAGCCLAADAASGGCTRGAYRCLHREMGSTR
jgi:hypothetical protein